MCHYYDAENEGGKGDSGLSEMQPEDDLFPKGWIGSVYSVWI